MTSWAGRMTWARIAASALVLLALAACHKNLPPPTDDTTIRGVAEQAEVVDDATVVVLSTGYGYDESDAMRDAYKAGVWLVASAMAQTDLEKVNLEGYKGGLLHDPTPWLKDVRTLGGGPEGEWFRVSLQLRVDRGSIRAELERRGIIASTRAVTSAVDYPTVMVVTQDQGAGGAAYADYARNEASSFLSDRGFEVLDAGAAAQLGDMRDRLAALSVGQDPAATIALSVGADVYFVVEAMVQGGAGSRQGTAMVKAYETTTARLLGSGNSVSHPRADGTATDAWLAAEATRDGISRVIDAVLLSWKRSLDEGRAYYIVVEGDFSDSAYKRQVKGILKDAVGERLTLKVETPKTLEFTARSMDDLSTLGDRVEIGLEGASIGYGWTVKNRQMLMLHVE